MFPRVDHRSPVGLYGIQQLDVLGPQTTMNWATITTIVIPDQPVAMSRARVSKYGAYYPTKIKRAIADNTKRIQAIVQSDGLDRLDEPIKLICTYVCSRPSRLRSAKSPEGRIRKTTKPDLDNYLKMTMDCLTKGGLWVDDNRVCEIEASKYYANKHEEPHTLIQVQVLR